MTLSLPLRVTPTGSIATVPDNSGAAVAQALALLVATRPGDRRAVPAYGLPDPLFDGFDVDEVEAAIEQWEPRADPTLLEVTDVDGGREQLVVAYPATPDPIEVEADEEFDEGEVYD